MGVIPTSYVTPPVFTGLDSVMNYIKVQALVYDILPSRRKVPESDARSVELLIYLSIYIYTDTMQSKHFASRFLPSWV